MNKVEQARHAVREYLSRDHGDFSEMSEEDVISTVRWLHDYRDNLFDLIPLAESHRGAWLACMNLLEHCEPTEQGHAAFIPDDQRLDPELRIHLQKWAFRALSRQIKMPASRGPKTKPLRDLRIQVAVYRATLCGLPVFADGNPIKSKTACEVVADELEMKPGSVKTIWQERPGKGE